MRKTIAIMTTLAMILVAFMGMVPTSAEPSVVTVTYFSDDSGATQAMDDAINPGTGLPWYGPTVWAGTVYAWGPTDGCGAFWNQYLQPAASKTQLLGSGGNWIWKDTGTTGIGKTCATPPYPASRTVYKVTSAEAVTGDIVKFKREFDIPANAFNVQGTLLLATDNAFYMYVNKGFTGVPLAQGNFYDGYDYSNFRSPTTGFPIEGSVELPDPGEPSYPWSVIYTVDVTGELQTGTNALEIVGINEYSTPSNPGTPDANPSGLIYELEVSYELATIEKHVSADEGYLGDIIGVTLDVEVPSGHTMTVRDEFPDFMGYVWGTFMVDGSPVVPATGPHYVETTVGEGDHTITFDLIVDSVEEMPVTGTNWAYLIYDGQTIDEDSKDVTVYPYCGFHKWAYLLSTEDGDMILEVGENIVWRLVIWVTNLYDWTMTDVVVTDRLAAELEIDEVELISKGDFDWEKKGNIKMTWDIGDLEPGETATLVLQISTRIYKGKQQYTSPGWYELNSGAALKFLNPDGIQLSANTGPIEFEVPGEWPEFQPYCVHYPESGNLYIGYEDWPNGDFDYNDFGMRFSFVEYYNLNWDLVRVTMYFEAIIYDSGMDHLIHIKRPINGQSVVDVIRPNPRPSAGPILGKDETPAGTYPFAGDVDVILYNTNKYTWPEKQIGEYVTVDITVVDPTLNPKTGLVPPRMFTNEAPMPFYDMDAAMANYDPWEEGTLYGSLFHIHNIQSTFKFGSPSIEVPYILIVPYTDWIPPWEDTTITGPYGYFDDFYRYGTPANWYHPTMCTNNFVGYGGLSWGPYV